MRYDFPSARVTALRTARMDGASPLRRSRHLVIVERAPVRAYLPRSVRLLTVLTALGALAVPASAQAAPAVPSAQVGETVTLSLHDLVTALPVRAEDRTGYERDKFRHWIDADSDGCNTRAEVLLEEAVEAPERSGRCTLTGGRWYSAYDDTYIDNPSGLDIDHFVPLAEAWDSGASTWTAAERQDYANDLGEARSLIAVSARTNRSKADQDPAEWLPPAEGYRCQYVSTWAATKLRWALSVDATEQQTLSDLAAQCPNAPVTVTYAR